MNVKMLAIWAGIAAALFAIFLVAKVESPSASAHKVAYSELLAQIDKGEIVSAKVIGDTIEAKDKHKQTITAVGPGSSETFQARLEKHGVAFEFQQPGQLANVLIQIVPFLFLLAGVISSPAKCKAARAAPWVLANPRRAC